MTLRSFFPADLSEDQENAVREIGAFLSDKVTNCFILRGYAGTGKTFLAKCIGFAACNANKKVLFTSAMDMINQLIAADVDHSLVKKLSIYTSTDLLIVDLC